MCKNEIFYLNELLAALPTYRSTHDSPEKKMTVETTLRRKRENKKYVTVAFSLLPWGYEGKKMNASYQLDHIPK